MAPQSYAPESREARSSHAAPSFFDRQHSAACRRRRFIFAAILPDFLGAYAAEKIARFQEIVDARREVAYNSSVMLLRYGRARRSAPRHAGPFLLLRFSSLAMPGSY